MGTEVAVSFSTLRAQLENEKSSLYKIDENIKKIVQTSNRFSNDRFNSPGDYSRGGPRLGGRNSYPDSKNDELFGKRKHETKTVFSRLSARTQDSDTEEEAGGGGGGGRKRARVVSAVSREVPVSVAAPAPAPAPAPEPTASRAAAVRAQAGDAQARTRNKRIFGALLGTLHKFKQEEIVLQTKEDKKAQVERKIEEQARLEKEREQKERKSLFAEREHKKATIKALEAKLGRVQEFERWEASQRSLAGFILTRAKPHVYWLPKRMTDKAHEKLNSSRKFHEKCMTKKRQELQEELHRIEQRCLRPRGPAAKENDPQDVNDLEPVKTGPNRKQCESGDSAGSAGQPQPQPEDDKGRRRDKFAMDADVKEESDGDGDGEGDGDQPRPRDDANTDGVQPKEEKEVEESKTETSVEQNTTAETEEIKANETSAEDKEMEPKETETETNTIETTESQDTPAEPQITNDTENVENNEHS